MSALAFAGCDDGEEEPTASNCPADPPPVINDSFPEPEVRHSVDGVLETTLRASYGEVELAGKTYETMNYEGMVPGPTLVFCPGDRVTVSLENDLGDTPAASVPLPAGPTYPHSHQHGVANRQSTNIHTHGLHVNPGENAEGVTADDIFLDVVPGKEQTYEYEIPEDHPPGAYWYHPHRHGNVEPQIFAGMLGAIVVEGGLDEVPELADVPVRNLVIHYTELGKDGKVVPVEESVDPGTPRTARETHSELLLNGADRPEIPIRPGEVQRWRITNANDNPILDLELQGHEVYLLAEDGNTLKRMEPRDHLLVGPSQRREILVQGGAAGEYDFRTRAFSQFQGGGAPAERIASMVSAGEQADDEIPMGIQLSDPEDLREEAVAERHDIVFSEAPLPHTEGAETEFLVNGKLFDPERVDQTMKIDEVHEWSIENATTEWHTFHIHVNNFQVTGLEGISPGDVTTADALEIGVGAHQDTVALPPGKTVTFLTKPTDFTGKFVFHCHMANHEDRGMMAVAEVTR